MSSIKLINGSCVDQIADAIVNAANINLWSGGGICGAIFKKAGYEELNKECKKIKTPLKEGDAVITSSCNMTNCKYIIHAVGPNLNKNMGTINKIFDAYYNSLDVLMKNNLHTIAFPLISSGIYSGFIKNPVLESTKFCIMAYEKFAMEHKNYNIDVILCAYTSKEYEEANKEFSFNKYIDSIEKK